MHKFTQIGDLLVFNLDPADVVINGQMIGDEGVQIVIHALRRQFIELSATVEQVPGIRSAMTKIEAIQERRALFDLMERFDGVKIDGVVCNLGPNQIDVNSCQLSNADVLRVHDALVWYRDHYVDAECRQRTMTDELLSHWTN